MAENALDAPTDCPACKPEGTLVWEDEVWTLNQVGEDLVLTLREHEDLGQLDDEVASQFGRIANRLVRIVEHRPDGSRAEVVRAGDGGTHFQVAVRGGTSDLNAVATRLANWGGDARA